KSRIGGTYKRKVQERSLTTQNPKLAWSNTCDRRHADNQSLPETPDKTLPQNYQSGTLLRYRCHSYRCRVLPLDGGTWGIADPSITVQSDNLTCNQFVFRSCDFRRWAARDNRSSRIRA